MAVYQGFACVFFVRSDSISATTAGCPELTKKCVAREGTDELAARVLYRAAYESGSPDTVMALFTSGVALRSLHDCARSQCVRCCERLLGEGQPSNATDEAGRTPADVASSTRMRELFRTWR